MIRGRTYVVQRQDWVKIGRTTDLTTRLAALREPGCKTAMPLGMVITEPLVLLATYDGGDMERLMHRWYSEHRVAGEWFHAAPVLADMGVLT